ncbi:epimerase moeS5 [Micromonospora sp. ATCC 39149]|uniref:sugar nucleotide-binding protein n=1 Tax=Micromonospora sp. (strain ATCC 39149 / NRRL 15099 / SCC 1413) TaxID=219305 RepID=UPI0001A50281|nr:sugar nucleotide-binding protein [Micromonospora sp. ATCC 39149]EEP74528.1 epimerase moeS5 [Micromonospora sp. ATCC 39149]
MTLLVVGASGYLGGEVCRQAVAAGERVVGTYHANPVELAGVEVRRLDVTDRAAVRALVAAVRPAAVVSTPYRYDDWAVTADGAARVACAAVEAGARLVHLSSDALHAGRPQPYADDDAPTPVFPYGAAKAAAETAVRAIDPGAALVRTSLIVGDERSRQIRLCLEALAGGVALFTDEVRCPVDVATWPLAVLELAQGDHAGLLNVAGPEAVSRADWGCWWSGGSGSTRPACGPPRAPASGLARPVEVRLDSSRAAGLLRTRLRGVSELLAP